MAPEKFPEFEVHNFETNTDAKGCIRVVALRFDAARAFGMNDELTFLTDRKLDLLLSLLKM